MEDDLDSGTSTLGSNYRFSTAKFKSVIPPPILSQLMQGSQLESQHEITLSQLVITFSYSFVPLSVSDHLVY